MIRFSHLAGFSSVRGWAIVGGGVIAETHARAVAALPGVELVSVVDLVPERAAELADRYGASRP